jgi:hypothetical protein
LNQVPDNAADLFDLVIPPGASQNSYLPLGFDVLVIKIRVKQMLRRHNQIALGFNSRIVK